MTDDAEFDRLRTLVAETFEVDPTRIERQTTAADVDGWDSVSHATMIMAVEDGFGIQFPDAEIFTFKDVGAMFDRVMQLRQR